LTDRALVREALVGSPEKEKIGVRRITVGEKRGVE